MMPKAHLTPTLMNMNTFPQLKSPLKNHLMTPPTLMTHPTPMTPPTLMTPATLMNPPILMMMKMMNHLKMTKNSSPKSTPT
jgi:hypothetical protein